MTYITPEDEVRLEDDWRERARIPLVTFKWMGLEKPPIVMGSDIPRMPPLNRASFLDGFRPAVAGVASSKPSPPTRLTQAEEHVI
jgi:hypothetical protein